jgi:hypothetical protein
MGTLSLGCPDAAAFQYVTMDNVPNYDPADEVNVSCTVDVLSSVVVDTPRPLSEIAKGTDSVEALVAELVFSEDETAKLAEVTTGQSDNSQWFAQRAGRITGSKMHAVYTKMKTVSSKPTTNTDSLLKQVMGYTSPPENIPALKYGRTMEGEARATYIKFNKSKHQNLCVAQSGLHVSASQGYIGASPDGLVSCGCCGGGVLEIKCPISISSTAPDPSNLSYLKDGKLARNHQYFTQIQGQMAMTGREWCDFFVYTKRGHYQERILFCADYWETVSATIRNFFVQFVAPELLTSKLKHVSELSPLDVPSSVEKTPRVQIIQVSVKGKAPVRPTKRKSRRKPAQPVYVCGSCGQPCQEEEDIALDSDFSIGCDKCMQWFHWGCVGFGGAAYNTWYCPDCSTC